MSAASFKGDGVYDLILTVDVTHEVSTRMVQASHDREGTLAGSSQGSAILPVLLYVYGQ
jgi:cysteine synthase